MRRINGWKAVEPTSNQDSSGSFTVPPLTTDQYSSQQSAALKRSWKERRQKRICHNLTWVLIQKRKRKCDNHLSLVTVELRIRNRGATRGESFKFLIHGQLKTSHTADPKKRFAQQHPPLCLLLPPAAHNSPQNNPTGVAARCDQKFTS